VPYHRDLFAKRRCGFLDISDACVFKAKADINFFDHKFADLLGLRDGASCGLGASVGQNLISQFEFSIKLVTNAKFQNYSIFCG
jgi:hypothetical protein